MRFVSRAEFKRRHPIQPRMNIVTEGIECVDECLAFFPYGNAAYDSQRDECLSNCYEVNTTPKKEEKTTKTNLLLPLGIGLALGALALSQS